VLCEKYSGKEWAEALAAALPARQQEERPARFNRPLPVTAGCGVGAGPAGAAGAAGAAGTAGGAGGAKAARGAEGVPARPDP